MVQVAALRELLSERDRGYIERFQSSERNVVTAMSAAKEAVSTAMAAAEKAVTKAEGASEKRFDAVNEFRQSLADQQITFARADAVNSAIKMVTEVSNTRFAGIEKRLDEISKWQAQQIGHGKGLADVWGWFIGILGVAGGFLIAWLRTH